MKFNLSWTDSCFLIVMLLSAILIVRSLRREHNKKAFKQIFSQPLIMSVAIVLSFFLLISILDSIHVTFTDRLGGYSLLDHILAPLDKIYEQSYSKPLSLTAFSKEIVMIRGKSQQIYPHLTYPPFISIHARNQFIWMTFYQTFFLSAGLILTIWLSRLIMKFFAKKRADLGLFFVFPSVFKENRVTITALLTGLLCLWLCLFSYKLSRSLHLFGTGQIGQDIFYYTIKSIRTGVVIGTLTTLFMMPLALLAGIAAGYFGGLIDDMIQYIYTTLSSIPGVLLISASVLSMQTYIANHPEYFTTLAQSADARLIALCLILGLTSWTTLCRLLRAETLKLREIDYVFAAVALGSHSLKIMFKHILPNVMHIVIITVVLDFSFLVLAEAVLSYVGVGVSPMTISWGNMINAARLELARDPVVWWPMIAAFVLMFTLVLASNVFADAVRDAFDPRNDY